MKHLCISFYLNLIVINKITCSKDNIIDYQTTADLFWHGFQHKQKGLKVKLAPPLPPWDITVVIPVALSWDFTMTST